MPSKSGAQARMMAGAAHSADFAKRVGVPQSVAQDFNQADKRTGILRKKKPKRGGAPNNAVKAMGADAGI